jgi:hypothetical protein
MVHRISARHDGRQIRASTHENPDLYWAGRYHAGVSGPAKFCEHSATFFLPRQTSLL